MKRKDKIIREISRVAKKLFGDGGGQVYLYGSQARNDASPQSDWDLLVLTDDSKEMDSDEDRFVKFAFPFAEIGWRLGAQITPIHYTRSEWEAQRNTLFFINVTSEAILL